MSVSSEGSMQGNKPSYPKRETPGRKSKGWRAGSREGWVAGSRLTKSRESERVPGMQRAGFKQKRRGKVMTSNGPGSEVGS